MIFDKRLKLAENLDVVAGRNIAGIKQSDLFPVLSLGEMGRGEQLFCCVTIRETFAVPGGDPIYIKMSLREELFTYTGYIDSALVGVPSFARHTHNKNPILATSGYIELAPDGAGTSNSSSNNNFVAGKKFTFAINPYSGSINSTTYGGTFGLVKKFQGGSYAYFLFEEFTSGPIADAFTASTALTSGKIDVDIVSIADSGAGVGFSDVHSYPTRTIVQ
jgi:hypothetical protein